MADVFDDLAAEYRRLDGVLGTLSAEQWAAPSAAEGWSVADVVLHLAQSEETIGDPLRAEGRARLLDGGTVDGWAEGMVAGERGAPPDEVLARWRKAAFATPERLRAHPPGTRLAWVRSSLSPRALATTRIAEHWAHGLDVTGPLGIPYPDTGRIRHVAWLAHRTLPYAFAVEGLEPVPVFCGLTAPDGASWTFGDPDAPDRVTGPAAEFCRVGARRLRPDQTGLVASGPRAADALRVLRNYAA